jgi:hypothetical protein
VDSIVVPAEDLSGEDEADLLQKISTADVIIGPWMMVINGLTGLAQRVSQTIVSSTAAKIMFPIPQDGWLWAGVDEWEPQQVAQDMARQVEQLTTSGQIKWKRRWGVGAIIGTVLGGLVLLVVVFVVTVAVIDLWF